MTKHRALIIAAVTSAAIATAAGGCSTFKSVLALDKPDKRMAPIHNPFQDYYVQNQPKPENIILRTKKGDRSIEIELPGSASAMTDFAIPMSPDFRDGSRSPASSGGYSEDIAGDTSYKDRKPSISDREITSGFKSAYGTDEGSRRDVESGLGVIPAEDSQPEADSSYLAAIDHVKRLYKTARYEAALLEIDELLRQYPTDSKLYEMRGTLFDRIGRTDLAIRSWNQAVRLDPANQSLRKFIERKQQKRGLASP